MTRTALMQPEPVRLSTLDTHNTSKNLYFQTSALETTGNSSQDKVYELGSSSAARPDKSADDEDFEGANGTLPSPTTASEVLERWNRPRGNVKRTFACFFAFIVMGANDAALGPLIPYLQSHYNLTYSIVSLLFLSPLLGYSASALLNDLVHQKFGRRGIAFLGPLCHLLAYVVAALHPPFPLLVVIFVLAGFGNGLEDAAWNAWLGNMANANEVLGFLHGFYGLGATIAPTVATTLVTTAGVPWWYFYYVMLGLASVELITSVTCFWASDGAAFRLAHPKTTTGKGNNRLKEALFTKSAGRVTWACTAFIVVYMGIEVGLGGWVTEFMLKERDASDFAAGMSATGFWLGLTVGRVVLGFVTPKLGEKLAIMIYLPLTMTLQLIFWLVPQFYVSVVAVSFQGFFLGPLFPAAVVVITKLLPRHLHVTSIGFMAAIGGGGAAIFPFAVGAVAQSKGVGVLQPIILALLVVCLGAWLSLPRIGKKRE